jgi:ketosteroid isomerase-like protein
MTDIDSDENQTCSLVENWVKAVRGKDIDGILAYHTDDIVMFDVPPPFQSKGIKAYRKTWDTFYAWAKDLGVFDIIEMKVIAGGNVAFCCASMRCAGYDDSGKREELKFRLTIGLEKISNQWMIAHEHHSLPST